MKYDDASWHYGGDYPKDLPNENGATHIGMFVAWCMLNGLAGELHIEDGPEELEKLRNREETPGQWFINNCDEKFTDEDLSDEGNQFAEYYFNGTYTGNYITDYEMILGGQLDSLYHVTDTWENFDKMNETIARHFAEFRDWQHKRNSRNPDRAD